MDETDIIMTAIKSNKALKSLNPNSKNSHRDIQANLKIHHIANIKMTESQSEMIS